MPENKTRRRIFVSKKSVFIAECCICMPFISHCYEQMLMVWFTSSRTDGIVCYNND